MPKQVDHDERRRHIVEALLRIAGTRGLDAVSLREVAQEAGISMGAVQHYFATKNDMLRYAVRHWLSMSVHQGFAQRLRERLGVPDGVRPDAVAVDPVTALRAIAAESLPYDEASRAGIRVGLAFQSGAAADPTLAEDLRPAVDGFVATLEEVLARVETPIDRSFEARRLAALLDGLRFPVLIGAVGYEEALAVVHRHIDSLGQHGRH
jgi:TetR/AcrR family transcriptional regulator, transcriptional repressor of bet genes